MIIWTPTALSVLNACVLYFCICTCTAQLSIFYMERRSRNTLIIIIIINIDLHVRQRFGQCGIFGQVRAHQVCSHVHLCHGEVAICPEHAHCVH